MQNYIIFKKEKKLTCRYCPGKRPVWLVVLGSAKTNDCILVLTSDLEIRGSEVQVKLLRAASWVTPSLVL